jgi:hypothetical protein
MPRGIREIERTKTPAGGRSRKAQSALLKRGCAADAEYRDCSCRGAEREAEWSACKRNLARQLSALMPNPSFKPSPNGGPPGPVWRYAVHFRQPGPGVPPSVPA